MCDPFIKLLVGESRDFHSIGEVWPEFFGEEVVVSAIRISLSCIAVRIRDSRAGLRIQAVDQDNR